MAGPRAEHRLGGVPGGAKQREAIQSAGDARREARRRRGRRRAEHAGGRRRLEPAVPRPAAGPRRRAPPPTRGPPRHQRERQGRAADVQRGVLPGLATPGGAARTATPSSTEWMRRRSRPGAAIATRSSRRGCRASEAPRAGGDRDAVDARRHRADVLAVLRIVAEQGELIERIDANTEASVNNVEEAHNQILKYSKYVQGNRGSSSRRLRCSPSSRNLLVAQVAPRWRRAAEARAGAADT